MGLFNSGPVMIPQEKKDAARTTMKTAMLA